jgi:hypothetical protein
VIAAFLVISLTAGAQERNPFTIKVLKAERGVSNVTYVMYSVENTSDQRFESTVWSCVFLNKGTPVHQEENIIQNVPPHDRAIERVIQSYGGPFDDIACRFMRSRPSRCP